MLGLLLPERLPLIGRDEHLAGLTALVHADDAGGCHLLDEPAGTRIADGQPPLQQTDAAPFGLQNDLDRLVEQFVTGAVSVDVLVAQLYEFRMELGLPAILEKGDQGLEFGVFEKRALGADQLR